MAAALATVRNLYEDLEPRGRSFAVFLACEPTEPYGTPPAEPVRLDPLTAEELTRIRDGECDVDLYERGVAWAARVRSAIDVRLAEGLHLLRRGDRHVLFRSRGGGDEEDNQVGLCEFHHLRCVHAGWLTVTGRAPDGHVWRRKGVPFTGMA